MNFIKKILLVLLTLPTLLVSQGWHFEEFEYQNNSSVLLKSNHIKTLLVIDDSTMASCPVDHFEYDSMGNVALYRAAVMDDFVTYQFNHKNQVIVKTYFYDDSDSAILVSRSRFFYKKGIFQYGEGQEYDSFGKVKKTTRITKDPNRAISLENPVYNISGQLISHTHQDIVRPCLTAMKGTFVFKYHYLENGLISKIDICKEGTLKIVKTWHFIYNLEQ